MNKLIYKNAIKDYFAGKKGILCVYLFGSVAANKDNPYSDVDIAVLYDDSVASSEYTDEQINLSVELSRILDRNADIIILNNASPYLKFQIIQKAVRVYENPARNNRAFEARSLIEYFDFLPLKNMLEASLIRKIKEA